MAGNVRQKTVQRQSAQVLALVLVGAGLLLLGLILAFLLPRAATNEAADTGNRPGMVVPAEVNYPAPELSLHDLDGNEVALSDYQGQVVLVNNWATWCPPCRAEMPTLQKYYDTHQDAGFTIIAIESGEPKTEVAEFVRVNKLTFPVWLDLRQEALEAFRNFGLPSSYVIDREGQIRLAWTGAITAEMLEKFVTPLLEE